MDGPSAFFRSNICDTHRVFCARGMIPHSSASTPPQKIRKWVRFSRLPSKSLAACHGGLLLLLPTSSLPGGVCFMPSHGRCSSYFCTFSGMMCRHQLPYECLAFFDSLSSAWGKELSRRSTRDSPKECATNQCRSASATRSLSVYLRSVYSDDPGLAAAYGRRQAQATRRRGPGAWCERAREQEPEALDVGYRCPRDGTSGATRKVHCVEAAAHW